MSTSAWCAWFVLDSAFAYWVIYRGGADWLEGWKSLFFIDILANAWSAEQIRLYMTLLWICHALWFVVGLVLPEARW